MFFWWVEQIILPKNIFLPHLEIVQNFHYFVRSAPVDIPSKIQFSKNCLKCCRNVSFDESNKLFCQKIFSYPFWDSAKFSLFCKVRVCRFSVKNSIFQKLPQMLTKCFFWWVERKILPKNFFLTPFWDSTKFSLFCKVRACRFSVKSSIFQKLP